MAHYTVSLPGNMPADVRQGKVIKKSAGFVKHWPWIKFKGEERTGYIVTISTANNDPRQYHLLKSADGSWPATTEIEMAVAVKMGDKWEQIEDDQVTLAIKKAIDEYENK